MGDSGACGEQGVGGDEDGGVGDDEEAEGDMVRGIVVVDLGGLTGEVGRGDSGDKAVEDVVIGSSSVEAAIGTESLSTRTDL